MQRLGWLASGLRVVVGLWLAVGGLLSVQARAEPCLPLPGPVAVGAQGVDMGRHVQYLADADGQLTLDALLADPCAPWRQHDKPVINFGYTPVVYWYRFQLIREPLAPPHGLLALQYPLLDQVDIYAWQGDTALAPLRLGDRQPFAERPIRHRHLLYPLILSASQPLTVYLRVASDSSMQIPLRVLTEQQLLIQDQTESLLQGIYFGVMLAMMLYNLFLYLSFRDTHYLLYVASVLCVALVQATLRGYSYQYLWPDSPLLQHYHMPIVVSLSGATVAFFSLGFLNLWQRQRALYWIVLALAVSLTLNALLSPWLGYPISVRVGVGVTMLYAVVGFISGFWIWRRGYKPAFYFTSAYFVLFAGTLVIALNKFGWLPRNFLTENAQEIGSLLEVLLLSFALADRINVLRREKEQAQLTSTVLLEHKVEERTQELRLTLDQLARVNAQLARQSREDGLTGALNRRAFDEILSVEWKRAYRSKLPVTLLMCDIDHFKRFNDNYGHLVGDDCLKVVASCLKSALWRPDDLVFRYGGEEFALILPNTPLEGACQVAERIRHTVASHPFMVAEQSVSLSLSIGVASVIPQNPDGWVVFTRRADAGLYEAKRQGRNRVVVQPD